MRRLLIIILTILSSNIQLTAQEKLPDILKKINQRFYSFNTVSCDIGMKTFCVSSRNKLLTTESYSISKLNNTILSSGTGVMNYTDAKISISVNQELKKIILSKTPKEGLLFDFDKNLDKVIRVCNSIKVEKKGDRNIYTLEVDKFGVDKLVITINVTEIKIEKMQYYFENQNPDETPNGGSCKKLMTEISFNSYLKEIKGDMKKFEQSYYISKDKKGRFIPSSHFKGYEIINYYSN